MKVESRLGMGHNASTTKTRGKKYTRERKVRKIACGLGIIGKVRVDSRIIKNEKDKNINQTAKVASVAARKNLECAGASSDTHIKSQRISLQNIQPSGVWQKQLQLFHEM